MRRGRRAPFGRRDGRGGVAADGWCPGRGPEAWRTPGDFTKKPWENCDDWD